MDRFESSLKDLIEIFERRGDIASVFLFGSYGTSYERPGSDIDLAVLYVEGSKVTLDDELELEVEISLKLGTDDFDLVNLNRAPLYLRYRVVASGKIIYERSYELTSDFMEETYRAYRDYAIDMHAFRQEYHQALMEAYRNG